jgi:hypothetical protein
VGGWKSALDLPGLGQLLGFSQHIPVNRLKQTTAAARIASQQQLE